MLSVSMFGGLAVRDQTGDELPIAGAKPRALVAYLALAPRRAYGRAHLADLLWPNGPKDEARHSLRQALSVVRRVVDDALCVSSDAVKLDERQFEVDALRFAQLAESPHPADWQRAVALYAGELLGDFDIEGTPFSEWVEAQRRRSRESIASLLARIASWQCSEGDVQAAIATARRIVAIDPYDEVERRRVMRLLLRDGQAGAALREFADLSALLRELDVEPCDATVRLHRAALSASAQPEPLLDDFELLQTYAHALEQLPDAVIVTDMQMRIVGWSDGAVHAFGFSKADALGRTPGLLHGSQPGDEVPALLARRIAEVGSWSGTVRVTRRDGQRMNLRRSVSALRLPSGRTIGTFGVSAR